MIKILRRLTAVLLFIPFAIGEVVFFLFSRVVLDLLKLVYEFIVMGLLKYILTGKSLDQDSNVEQYHDGPNFDRTARWCRAIAGDKKS